MSHPSPHSALDSEPRPGVEAGAQDGGAHARLRVIDPSAYGLFLLVAILPLTLLQRASWYIPKIAWGQPPSRVLTVICAVAWLLAWLSGARGVLRGRTFVRITTLLVPVSVACSYVSSVSSVGGAERAAKAGESLFWAVVDALFVMFAVDSVRREGDARIITKTLMICGTVAALVLLVQALTGANVAAPFKLPGLRVRQEIIQGRDLLRYGLARPQGLSAHPLEAGAVLAIIAPIALAWALKDRPRTRWGWLAWMPYISMVGAVVTSISRVSLLGVGLGTLVVALAARTDRSIRAVGVMFVGVGLALTLRAGLATSLRLSITEAGSDPSLASRALGRQFVTQSFSQHRWLGLGPGTYDLLIQPVLDNQFLAVLLQTGLVGLGAYALWFLSALASGVRSMGSPPNAGEPLMLAGLLGSTLVAVAVNLILDTGSFLQVHMVTLVVIATIGALAAVRGGPGKSIQSLEPATEPSRADD